MSVECERPAQLSIGPVTHGSVPQDRNTKSPPRDGFTRYAGSAIPEAQRWCITIFVCPTPFRGPTKSHSAQCLRQQSRDRPLQGAHTHALA